MKMKELWNLSQPRKVFDGCMHRYTIFPPCFLGSPSFLRSVPFIEIAACSIKDWRHKLANHLDVGDKKIVLSKVFVENRRLGCSCCQSVIVCFLADAGQQVKPFEQFLLYIYCKLLSGKRVAEYTHALVCICSCSNKDCLSEKVWSLPSWIFKGETQSVV